MVNYLENKHPNKQTVVTSITPQGVTANANTTPNCIGPFSNGSGDITFYLTYTESYQPPTPPPTVTDTPVDTSLSLGWGDQLIKSVTAGKWSLTAVLFNGTTLSFAASNHSNPYVNVTYLPGSNAVQINGANTSQLGVATGT
jgi:hypothetical protein